MLCDFRAGILVYRIQSARPRDGFIAEIVARYILAQRPAKSQETGPQEMHGKQGALTSRKPPGTLCPPPVSPGYRGRRNLRGIGPIRFGP